MGKNKKNIYGYKGMQPKVLRVCVSSRDLISVLN